MDFLRKGKGRPKLLLLAGLSSGLLALSAQGQVPDTLPAPGRVAEAQLRYYLSRALTLQGAVELPSAERRQLLPWAGKMGTRFAGRDALYGNFEARLHLFKFNAYLFPGTFGVMGLADAGRVYSGNDTRTGLQAFHTGFGGGAFVNILDQAVINVTYSFGEERLAYVGFDFLF